MRNNTAPKKAHEDETNVVYEFTCPDDACRRRSTNYVGLTRQTLKGRMKGHAYNGAIRDHYTTIHNRRPKVDELVQNSTIIHREPERRRLTVAEPVSIALRRPQAWGASTVGREAAQARGASSAGREAPQAP